jgi:hypothetical protein
MDYYSAGLRQTDSRHSACNLFDGRLCACTGECSCHRVFGIGAHVRSSAALGVWRVTYAEPEILGLISVNVEDCPTGPPVLHFWGGSCYRTRHPDERLEVVVRPLYVVTCGSEVIVEAMSAEVRSDETRIRVSLPRLLGSGWVVSVALQRAGGAVAREEYLPTHMASGGATLPPDASLVAEAILRAEAVGLRLGL